MKKMTEKCLFIMLTVIVLFTSSVNAATLTCDGSQSDCQAKLKAAADGDTVTIPAGSFNWGSTYIDMIYTKNIHIMGSGIGKTVITGTKFAFLMRIKDKASWRISDMTLDPTGSDPAIKIISTGYATTSTYGWRIDHIAFSGTSTGAVQVYGETWGVIDHCTFNKPSCAIMISAAMYGVDTTFSGEYDLSLPLALGTGDAVYVEDCTFTFTTTNQPNVFDMDGGGGRIVFRYNTINDGFLYNHWNRKNGIAGTKWEVYNNKFIGGAYAAQGGSCPARFQAGTGVIFNNTVRGYYIKSWKLDELRGCGQESNPNLYACDGTHAWDGNIGNGITEGKGWPCLNQIGRAAGKTLAQIIAGDKQASSPAYAWNNGAENGCSEGTACTDSITFSPYNPCPYNTLMGNTHSNGEYDYINNGSTPMPGYIPYTYPHPLTLSDKTTGPSQVKNLQIINK